MADAKAKAEEIAQSVTATNDTKVDDAQAKADAIIADAKAKAEEIRKEAEAKAAETSDVAYKSVSKKQLVDGYNEGLSHQALARKFFGSDSEESVRKVSVVINPVYGIDDDIDAEVTE